MITIFTFEGTKFHWAYDDETSCISGSYDPDIHSLNPACSLSIEDYQSLKAYINFVAEINDYSTPAIIILEYSRETHSEYFI